MKDRLKSVNATKDVEEAWRKKVTELSDKNFSWHGQLIYGREYPRETKRALELCGKGSTG